VASKDQQSEQSLPLTRRVRAARAHFVVRDNLFTVRICAF
jgi:hypothetical protein